MKNLTERVLSKLVDTHFDVITDAHEDMGVSHISKAKREALAAHGISLMDKIAMAVALWKWSSYLLFTLTVCAIFYYPAVVSLSLGVATLVSSGLWLWNVYQMVTHGITVLVLVKEELK